MCQLQTFHPFLGWSLIKCEVTVAGAVRELGGEIQPQISSHPPSEVTYEQVDRKLKGRRCYI